MSDDELARYKNLLFELCELVPKDEPKRIGSGEAVSMDGAREPPDGRLAGPFGDSFPYWGAPLDALSAPHAAKPQILCFDHAP